MSDEYYGIREFLADVKMGMEMARPVADAVFGFMKDVAGHFDRINLPVSIVNVGSTAGPLPTLMVDPIATDLRHPLDTDLCIISERNLERRDIEKLLEELLPQGITIEQDG